MAYILGSSQGSNQSETLSFINGRESEKAIRSLIKKHQMTNETNQPIIHIHAIVRACDESLLARDRYWQLAAVEVFLICEYLIANHRIEITNLINKDIRIGTFNIDKNDDLSNNLEESDNGIIVDEAEIGNGAYSGDRCNIGHKQSHMMMTICLLNENEKVLKPEHQYCICLYIGREKYRDLAKIGELFHHQLSNLKNNRICSGLWIRLGLRSKIRTLVLGFDLDFEGLTLASGFDLDFKGLQLQIRPELRRFRKLKDFLFKGSGLWIRLGLRSKIRTLVLGFDLDFEGLTLASGFDLDFKGLQLQIRPELRRFVSEDI
ncbi:hypothetical protein C1645_840248 [Glomus cerebriforme]|uniref:Uncharacterized protein n=1 Tax=Glomus cerebriforme TaxID=658196 RepID=A0A397S4H3_9GLOM|nr:hypothetical protein C1645_840248 [Glomus cerebriforme]